MKSEIVNCILSLLLGALHCHTPDHAPNPSLHDFCQDIVVNKRQDTDKQGGLLLKVKQADRLSPGHNSKLQRYSIILEPSG